MSPKTTPSAAKLKPAAPIAETELRFSAEILATCIATDHSISRPTPVLELGSSMTIGGSRRSVSAKIISFRSPLDNVSSAFDRRPGAYRKASNSGQKACLFSKALALLFRSS